MNKLYKNLHLKTPLNTRQKMQNGVSSTVFQFLPFLLEKTHFFRKKPPVHHFGSFFRKKPNPAIRLGSDYEVGLQLQLQLRFLKNSSLQLQLQLRKYPNLQLQLQL